MKLIEDNAGCFPGEVCHRPVCSKCGYKRLYKQVTGALHRLKKCPQCGHVLDWSPIDKKVGV